MTFLDTFYQSRILAPGGVTHMLASTGVWGRNGLSFPGIHGLKGYGKMGKPEWKGCSKLWSDEWEGPLSRVIGRCAHLNIKLLHFLYASIVAAITWMEEANNSYACHTTLRLERGVFLRILWMERGRLSRGPASHTRIFPDRVTPPGFPFSLHLKSVQMNIYQLFIFSIWEVWTRMINVW